MAFTDETAVESATALASATRSTERVLTESAKQDGQDKIAKKKILIRYHKVNMDVDSLKFGTIFFVLCINILMFT